MASLVAKSTYTPRRRKKRAWLYQTHQSCPCPLIHGGIDAVEPPREVCASLRPRLTLCTLRRYLSRLRVRGTARVAGMCVNGDLQLAFCCTSTSCEHHSGGVSLGRWWEACIYCAQAPVGLGRQAVRDWASQANGVGLTLAGSCREADSEPTRQQNVIPPTARMYTAPRARSR